MTLTVLVPSDDGVRALAEIPDVKAVRYTPGEPLPLEAAQAEVLIPGTHRGDDRAALLGRLPNLKLVQLLSAGAEDWVGAVPEGVLLSTCRGAHGGSTAEWVVAVLLSIHRELGSFAADQAAGRWQRRGTDTLQGKRVLIVGAGDLGHQLRRRLEPFDAAVTMVGMRARDDVHSVDELPCLLGEHDIVVLMVPLTSRTHGMVDAAFLARMADGAVLVNAARGPIVQTEALLTELTSGRLRAALDVTDPEPLPAGHPLWTAPNLLLTPHVAGTVRDASLRSYAVAAAEIARYSGGELPHNLVHGEY
ncbi:2-hydroxyacid dehydrogenase [Amycolatopsis acidiphila]|uniref:2-hydroxyacid dehydrogenase n=1 Tax=Amycolatopsis acidiphila TaxID=715473 RepID=A0A558A8J3_9PSEU|nr:2-hydroxyacid dehydrogenase [Amycolatopsis acidiphila]TVT20579.1 2-hydroxyacid dehydrogenase [Amycolatopsis acidiphila]UIJ61427.1 2-hydroxyacid dehydrogenase [Amycolatopsis acidiphila]GHG77754.1 phosphoglycerate dehydrogenase [Amycolatopsis acidiphila]